MGGANVTAPELSIVIVTFNVRDDVARCLESLTANAPRVAHELVVVDNASMDGTGGLVRERWPGVRLLQLERNAGFAAANNAGIRSGTSRLVLLLNPDTVVRAGAIDTLAARLDAVPAAAAAGPRLVDADGVPELSFGSMVSPLAEARQKTLMRLHARGVGIGRRIADWLTSQERFVDWVSGACLLVRRADAEAVGLLDERYFMYLEDVDFCAALRARGRRILFTPAAEVMHLRGRSRAAAPTAVEAAYRRAQVAFYEKHHPRWAPVLRAYLRARGRLH
jgi:GT2 family glycosyltransferase